MKIKKIIICYGHSIPVHQEEEIFEEKEGWIKKAGVYQNFRREKEPILEIVSFWGIDDMLGSNKVTKILDRLLKRRK